MSGGRCGQTPPSHKDTQQGSHIDGAAACVLLPQATHHHAACRMSERSQRLHSHKADCEEQTSVLHTPSSVSPVTLVHKSPWHTGKQHWWCKRAQPRAR
jgi:hypothetical protein